MFICQQCGSKFTNLQRLVTHRRRSHGMRMAEARFNPILREIWPCPERRCDSTFTRSSSLYRHLREVHGIEPFDDDDED